MSKRVLILEDDPGYEALLRNVAESRGWQFQLGAQADEVAGSADWADVAIIDLDAVAGTATLRSVRALRPALPIVVVTGDETIDLTALGADAIVHGLPGNLVDAVNAVTAPPDNVIDLTDATARSGGSDRPWYATS